MMSVAEHPATARPGDEPQPSEGLRRSPSVFGLLIVSGLNVVSLAFIAYHYASHPGAPAASPVHGPTTGDLMTADQSWPLANSVTTTASVFGNVDLVPASKLVLDIASGIVNENSRLEEGQRAPAEPSARTAEKPVSADDRTAYWVQLGALSKEETARQYWSVLKQRHATLLQNEKPHYVGPADGGGLHHIRIGPLKGDAASVFCAKLEAEGADCFCVRPPDERS